MNRLLILSALILCLFLSTESLKRSRKRERKGFTDFLNELEDAIKKKDPIPAELLSRKKPTGSKSGLYTFSSNNWPTSNAVDGVYGRDNLPEGCSITKRDDVTKASWFVDLEENADIGTIRIHARKDCCGSELANLTIQAGLTMNSLYECATFPGKATTGDVLDFVCDIWGRYVFIASHTSSNLALCEVEVFRGQVPLSRNMKTGALTGIKTGEGVIHPTANAVDGSLDGALKKCSVTQKTAAYAANWFVDLGKTADIKYLKIYVRSDCCADNLKDMSISVGAAIEDAEKCAVFKGPAKTGELITLDCKRRGQFVYIEADIDELVLCEVNVYGKYVKECLGDKSDGVYDYAGTLDETESGFKCQRWDAVSPHRPSKYIRNIGDILLGSMANYCRQPKIEPRERPWCYTREKKVEWEYCDIEKC